MLLFGHDAGAGQPLLVGSAHLVIGIVAGFVIGVIASLLGVVPDAVLLPALAAILLISAVKVWRHR